DAARRQAAAWSDAEVDAALAHHPRIGKRAPAAGSGSSGAEAEHSRREQAGAGTGDRAAAVWLEANRAYEERFGRIFLVRAAGRSPQEMLAQLHERLRNDPAVEARVRAGQLAEIAVPRLAAQLAGQDWAPAHLPSCSTIETLKKHLFQ
ncbi:hypothetical protein HER39_13120, partial [Arthrobacter deserti]|nr:hypothetical protein [Arthrobacter deserti]